MAADTLFYNGNILTLDDAVPSAEALWIAEGRIVAVGNLADMEKRMPSDMHRINLEGKTLLPAFTDAHIHLWKVGDLLTFMLDLRGVKSIAAMQEMLADFARKNPKNAWILARGFNEARFEDGRMPTREDLDAAVPDRPVYVIRTCAHIAVLNSRALAQCGIHEHTTAPEGGEVRRDAAGSPTGVLTETALGLVRPYLPQYEPEAYQTMLLAAQEALLQQGIACATDPAVHPELLAVYRQMERDKALRIRVVAIPIRVPDGDDQPLPLPEPFESDFLKIDTVKFFSDGGLSGKTAALYEPYLGGSAEYGTLRLTRDFFLNCAKEAQFAGFRIATHAIGDRAIDLVLEVYEALAPENTRQLRHRIEHLGLPNAAQLARMHAINAFCVTQPIFLYELGPNFRQYLPAFYLDQVYPYRAVLDAGIGLAFSSDAPVVRNFSPLMGIQNAVERSDLSGFAIGSAQKISVSEAMRAYTLGAAEANGEAAHSGSLAPGKRADFAVLDQNPLETAPTEIARIRVLETWVDGIKRYEYTR